MKTYSAQWPGGSSASGVVMVTDYSGLDAHEAGRVLDDAVKTLAAKEKLTPAATVKEYRRLQQAILDANDGLKRANTQTAPRESSPRRSEPQATGPSDHQILDAMCATIAECTGQSDDMALRAKVFNSPGFRRLLQNNRAGMDIDTNLHGRRAARPRGR